MEYNLLINYRHGEQINVCGIENFSSLQKEVMFLLDRNSAVSGEISESDPQLIRGLN